ncbi:unnamed protein product [Brassica napus]|uniref:(rape) hypothetical protein n=1 Tax=Brassica napus TaxID=3708 RepID=A0A816J6U9_BRANA|nr:unnamed protein product [Brassica napus]
MAKQKAKSGTLASRESYVEYSRPSNTSTKTTVETYVCVLGFGKLLLSINKEQKLD